MSRKSKTKTPEALIKELGKVPANKMCADCSDKLPGYVNLTLNSYVCSRCAGVQLMKKN